jgi:hypothetical protein
MVLVCLVAQGNIGSNVGGTEAYNVTANGTSYVF